MGGEVCEGDLRREKIAGVRCRMDRRVCEPLVDASVHCDMTGYVWVIVTEV